jgi:signal peptidase
VSFDWMQSESPKPLWRDVAETVGVVLLVGLLLFAASGVWPPMVAVESGSMEPHLQQGDLVFVNAPDRWTGAAARDPGIVTNHAAEGYSRFGMRGDVVVFDPPERRGSPIIHRAMFHVEAGENWYDEADPDALPVGVGDCDALANCPAPHAGYITKGDANPTYDQAIGRAPPVRADWIESKAEVRVPWLGCLRLALGPNGCSLPV